VKSVQATARRGSGRRHGRALHRCTIARGLVELGVRQLIVAGGETSGACVQALDITQMQIGPQIDPGVPWCYCVPPRSALRVVAAPIGGPAGLAARHPADQAAQKQAEEGLHLTLKSGNFGTDDFFSKAFTVLA
jgi:uncharacterized protein YgbK (DUF1537 family)